MLLLAGFHDLSWHMKNEGSTLLSHKNGLLVSASRDSASNTPLRLCKLICSGWLTSVRVL